MDNEIKFVSGHKGQYGLSGTFTDATGTKIVNLPFIVDKHGEIIPDTRSDGERAIDRAFESNNRTCTCGGVKWWTEDKSFLN